MMSLHRLCAKTGWRIDDEIVHRKSSAVDENSYVNDEAHETLCFHGADQPYEREDEHEIIGKKTEQLSQGVMPVGTEHAIEEVESIAEEDTAEDDGRIRV